LNQETSEELRVKHQGESAAHGSYDGRARGITISVSIAYGRTLLTVLTADGEGPKQLSANISIRELIRTLPANSVSLPSMRTSSFNCWSILLNKST
jgi:hypothetical protein